MNPNSAVRRPDGTYEVDGALYVGDTYIYPVLFGAAQTPIVAIAPAGVANGVITVQSQTLFLIQQSMFFADNAAASQNAGNRLLPLCTVTITDNGSGKQLTNSATPVTSIFGTGELPFVWQNPRLCQSLTTLTFVVTNFDAAVTYNLRLVFAGLSLYRVSGA